MNSESERSARRATIKSTGLVGLLVLATYASILLTLPEALTWSRAAEISIQLLLPAALASSVFLCIACRLYHRAGVAWFAAAMTMIGVQGFPMFVAPTGSAGLSEPLMLWSAVGLGLALLALVRVAAARHVEIAPVPLGVAFGAALVLFRGLGSALPETFLAAPRAVEYGSLALLVVGAVLATVVWRQSGLPAAARKPLTAAVVLWSVSGSLRALDLTGSAGWSALAIVCALATCVLVMSTALELLWQAVRDDHEAVVQLQKQLLTLRASARQGVEQLHEVKGTIAGIASATDLIRHEERLTRQHREHLAEMLAQETARLQRLVHAGPRHATEAVDLDEVLQPLLTARDVQGQQVLWAPSGLQVVAAADELTEVLNILLHNAAEHAPGSPVHIFTRRHGEETELVVADAGPGVPAELRDRIFEWGYSRPGSAGQGVGLAMAHRVLARRGIRLQLDPDHEAGAAFVIRLQPVDQPAAKPVERNARLREAALLAH
jgi:signal transduction histidine kinase